MKSQENFPGKAIRFRFFKKSEFKYLSHLDIVSVITRALRRAGIKVKYSEGYNPKPKINFSPPTPLGIESLAEYGDIILVDYLQADEFLQKVNFSLKELNTKLERIKLIDSREISHKVPSLMEDVSVGMYSFELTPTTGECYTEDFYYTEDFIQNLKNKVRKDYTSPASLFDIKAYIKKHIDKCSNFDKCRFPCDCEVSEKPVISLNVFGYLKIVKDRENEFFKFNHFLDFFREWVKDYNMVISNVIKREVYVFRKGFLKTPMEVV